MIFLCFHWVMLASKEEHVSRAVCPMAQPKDGENVVGRARQGAAAVAASSSDPGPDDLAAESFGGGVGIRRPCMTYA